MSEQTLFLKYSLFVGAYANRKEITIFFTKKKGPFLSKWSLVRETGLEPVR